MPGAGGRDDVEAADFPMVLVQIPMYNEREVRRALLFCVPPLIAGLLHVAVA
jgi:hypothetical protein